MAQQSYPFDAGAGAAVNEAQWQAMARRFRQTGVIEGSLSQLAVTADGSAPSVSVATGDAFVEGFFYRNDAALALTIATANATNPRIDTVVVRLDRVANTATLAVVTGTPEASPVAPTLSTADSLYELPLANVTVPAAAGVIVAGNVTDRRTLTKTFDRTAYVAKAGGDTITASTATVIPLVVRGAASQTANLLEARNDAGAVVVRFSAAGSITTEQTVQAGPAGSMPGAGQARVAAVTASTPGLVVRGAASQTANLAIFESSAGTALTRINAAGGIEVVNFFDAQAVTPTAAESNVIVNVGGSGLRRLVVGAADSAGAGFRTVRVAN